MNSMLEINKIYNEDCLVTMRNMPDCFVDMTVTSPPYDSLRDYNGYAFDFKNISKELFRITKDAGVVVWIVNDQTVNGGKSGNSFRQALFFQEIGFLIHDVMIWQKICPFQHKNRYIQSFEYMFVFSKGKRKMANLICDRKNKWAGTQIHGTERRVNGKVKQLSDIQKSKKVKEFGARFNIWDIPPEKNNKTGHPAVFSETVAGDHIITWSNPGDLVYDPFIGSGTTAKACFTLKRNYIGSEISKEYCDIINERIKHTTLVI